MAQKKSKKGRGAGGGGGSPWMHHQPPASSYPQHTLMASRPPPMRVPPSPMMPPPPTDKRTIRQAASKNKKKKRKQANQLLSTVATLVAVFCAYLLVILSTTLLHQSTSSDETFLVANYLRRADWSSFQAPNWQELLASSSLLSSTDDEEATTTSSSLSDGTTTAVNAARPRRKLRIGLLTGFVPSSQKRLDDGLLDHMVNKACYADLHGYDWIFNTTWGFDKVESAKPWMEVGTWHRVPQLQAALPNYDWLVYAETDWVVQDLSLPFEALIKDLELHNKYQAAVYLPIEDNSRLAFSAYVIMIRNNAFGRRLLENWREFSHGVCPRGNFERTKEWQGHWGHSDQPGIWWSLAKTHAEFTGNDFLEFVCNNQGYVESERYFGPELRTYFARVGAKTGSEGDELERVPDDQYIIWSQVNRETRSGLGYQPVSSSTSSVEWPHSFALHKGGPLSPRMAKDVEYCRRVRGCFAYYDDKGQFHVGCDGSAVQSARLFRQAHTGD